ncbi:hypothetical protein ABW20_dc0103313 [Dactylellina cionopaga]|nr:hypothetical protein ABW20_dc0103313 [Dactylellina cionopaga]
MEEYLNSSPYITDAPAAMDDMAVADGYFGGRQPQLPLPSNPYMTNTTETTADMAVTDGYFNGRPHQQLPVVHLVDDEPVKTAMPEPIRNQTQTEADGEARDPSRLSQEDDTQTVYSRVSFISERSTLPPSYTSRRVSYEEEDREEAQPTTEVRPLMMNECTKKARKFKFCCSLIVILIFTWALFGGIMLRKASRHFKESLAYYDTFRCTELLPGTYEETFKVPLNGTVSTFSLQQSVVYYNKPKDHIGGRINVEGYVNVEHATEADKIENDEVMVKVEYQVSNEKVLSDIDIKLTEDGVGIYTHGYTNDPEDGREICVFFKVTIKFPKPASTMEISQLVLDTEQLSIRIPPSLSLKVLDKALLNTITGNIWSKARQPSKIQDDGTRSANFGLQAKRLLIGTTTGNIRGVWGLADFASLESKSGNIDVGVMSVTSLPKMGAITDLNVKTVSGDVAVHSVSNDGTLHPFRKDLTHYSTIIKTVSGDIIGQYLLGSFLSVQTISGNIEADILPISPAQAGQDLDHQIELETDSKSGKIRMSFLEATDAKVMTEPKALLQMRAVQTVLSWFEEKRRKLLQLIQKHCEDALDQKEDIKAGQADVSATATDIEPLYVDPQDTGLASLTYFKATHSTVSGDIFMHYSAVFEGKIAARTLTGDIDIGGENVQIVKKERNGPVGKVVEAVHGKENTGFVDSESVSGNIRICVGDARF